MASHRPDLFYRGEYDTWFAKGESMGLSSRHYI
jgi:hypothetical protein